VFDNPYQPSSFEYGVDPPPTISSVGTFQFRRTLIATLICFSTSLALSFMYGTLLLNVNLTPPKSNKVGYAFFTLIGLVLINIPVVLGAFYLTRYKNSRFYQHTTFYSITCMIFPALMLLLPSGTPNTWHVMALFSSNFIVAWVACSIRVRSRSMIVNN